MGTIPKKHRVRNNLGLSQEDLAAILKVSRSTINLHERGERRIPFKNQPFDTSLYWCWTPGPLEARFGREPQITARLLKKRGQLELVASKITVSLDRSHQKLEKMERDFAWYNQCLDQMERYLGMNTETNSIPYNIIKGKYFKTLRLAFQCDEISQLLVKSRIAIMEVQLESYKEIISKLQQEENS